MKKAIIIHAWESNPEDHWYRDEEIVLREKGFEIFIPQMPGGSFVKENEWVDVLKGINMSENDVLIGHSLGAPAILRFLESNEAKVDKAILIAGFCTSLNLDCPNEEYPRAFVSREFNWKVIKQKANKFIVMNQIDDPWVPLSKGEELAENLGVELIKVEGDNHFDQMDLGLINKELVC